MIEAGLGARGAAWAGAAKAKPLTNARIAARISVSIGEPKRAMFRDGG